jgi:hypothetical protein
MSGKAIKRENSFTMLILARSGVRASRPTLNIKGLKQIGLKWLFPLLAVASVAVWQWATVTANYGGNWTALYCTGALQPHPPLVAAEHVYIFANSTGYDGQLYHYLAHDPLMRSGLKSFVDDPRLRYRRILVPALAFVLGLGRSDWIDPAYELVFLISVGLGVYWSCRFAGSWGLLFLLIPAIPITMDRLVIDAGLAALTAAFLCYRDGPVWKLFLVLACAALTRETGFLLIAAVCLFHLLRREHRLSAILATSAAPALAWYVYVATRTVGKPYDLSLIPLSAIAHVLADPWKYPPGTPFPGVIVLADYIALAGVLLAIGLAFYFAARGPVDVVSIAALLFASMAVLIQRVDHWQNVYDYGRVQTPLLICLAAIAARDRKPWLLLPVVMILPRVSIQFVPQVLGVVYKLVS